jgi:capsular exopolysaccharide synthesis family protein
MSKIYQALERVEPRVTAVLDPAPVAEGDGRHVVPDASEYERLASRIVHERSGSAFKTVLIASPDHGEGTSTVAAGLAVALAQRTGLRILLVEANFRTPGLAERLGVSADVGFGGALAGDVSLDSATVESHTPNLTVLPAGADGSARLLDGPRVGFLMSELADKSDVVVIDAPPVLPYADALSLASKVDRVVLVTQADRTQRGRLERAKDELEKAGAVILGVVLNRKTSHAPPWLQRRLNLR